MARLADQPNPKADVAQTMEHQVVCKEVTRRFGMKPESVKFLKEPRKDFARGVRELATITASLINDLSDARLELRATVARILFCAQRKSISET